MYEIIYFDCNGEQQFSSSNKNFDIIDTKLKKWLNSDRQRLMKCGLVLLLKDGKPYGQCFR